MSGVSNRFVEIPHLQTKGRDIHDKLYTRNTGTSSRANYLITPPRNSLKRNVKKFRNTSNTKKRFNFCTTFALSGTRELHQSSIATGLSELLKAHGNSAHHAEGNSLPGFAFQESAQKCTIAN